MWKKLFRANLRIAFGSLCGIVLIGGLGVFQAKADQWDKKTVMTISEPIQVRETVLEPGTYVFKLLNSASDRHVVQIFNADQTHIINTILAIPNYRLEPTGNSRFGFWETPPGYAKALRSWYYPGDNFGQEFPYPKHLTAIETASLTPAPSQIAPEVQPQPVPQASSEQPAPAPAPAPPPQETASAAAPPAAEPAPAEPAPAPTAEAAPAPAPEPQTPAPAQESLPKTAGTYSAVGLGGLCCLMLFGLIREKGLKRGS